MPRASRRSRGKSSLCQDLKKAITRPASRWLRRAAQALKALPGSLQILALSLALQVLCSLSPELVEWLAFNLQSPLAPLSLLTHMVSHASWGHLIGNFSFGLPAMLYLEGRVGKQRFLKFYVLCGVASLALHCLYMGGYGSMIGSSGAISGVFAGACLMYGNTRIEKAIALSLLLSFLVPQLFLAPVLTMVGIAAFGHIGGCLSGMILVAHASPHKR